LAYNIVYKKSVGRDLKRISKAETVRILDHISNALSQNAESCPVLKGQFAGLRKYRIGDYRVIYAIIENNVVVLRIAHRRDVYKKEL
jgi:mRNA interferase RelE/StbE